MDESFLDIKYVLNFKNIENIMDSIALATNTALLIVDNMGRPVSKHSGCTSYCKFVRSVPQSCELCEACDARGGLEAARKKAPYIYICHMGLLDFAVPIIYNNHLLGSIMCGQIRITDFDMHHQVDRVSLQIASLSVSDTVNLNNLLPLVPQMTLTQVKPIVTMVLNIVNYIVEEAIAKIEVIERAENSSKQIQMLQNLVDQIDMLPLRDKSHTMLQKSDNQLLANKKPDNNIILQRALDYINQNYTKPIKLESMAVLCNISAGYFSRLFHKSMNISYSEYINQLRIEMSIRLLAQTDKSINEVAEMSGFENCGYFSKVFKHYTGQIPTQYRKNH